MNIDDIYYQLVKKGQKVHEYRLNDEKRQKINPDDDILLVNNSDLNETFLVKVISKTIFPNWEEALKDTYQDDFYGLYDNLAEAIEACNKFYSKENVEKYGIVVFKLKDYRSSPESC